MSTDKYGRNFQISRLAKSLESAPIGGGGGLGNLYAKPILGVDPWVQKRSSSIVQFGVTLLAAITLYERSTGGRIIRKVNGTGAPKITGQK